MPLDLVPTLDVLIAASCPELVDGLPARLFLRH